MIELLEFIFKSFWHFIGFVILLPVISFSMTEGIAAIIKAFKCKKNKENDILES